MLAILIMSAKLATLDLLKIKVFRNKGFDVIVFVHGIINKMLSRDSNYIVDLGCGHLTKVWQLQHFYDRNYHYLNFVKI